ncbi:hypothetical protein BpHYR1_052114 [Brachionus plicatilis]|uniref:Secreted protein n=1 Tax=Brachionus plicatilis TaxID=10195 RepID=A0A3M7RQ70_BRAPC|nr:hypothetical protein BpHYR1_052114 [Brachionus plicatilis]
MSGICMSKWPERDDRRLLLALLLALVPEQLATTPPQVSSRRSIELADFDWRFLSFLGIFEQVSPLNKITLSNVEIALASFEF